MSLYDAIEDRIARLKAYVESLVYNVAQFTHYAKSSSDGQSDFVNGEITLSSEQATQPNEDVRRVSTWGVRSVPPKGVAALVVRAGGGGSNSVVVGCESSKYGSNSLGDGDVQIYNKTNGVQIYLKASDGSVTINDLNGSVVKLDGAGTVTVSGATATKLGPVGTLPVLVQGTLDSLGVPVTQAPAASATVVKAG